MDQSQWKQELLLLARSDSRYQSLLNGLNQLEPSFQDFRTALTPSQQQLLDSYISACEEMDHTMIQIAYEVGFSHGRRDGFVRI